MNVECSDQIDSPEAEAFAVPDTESLAEALLFASPGWAHDVGNSLQAAGLNVELLKLQCGQGPANAQARSAVDALQIQLDRIRQLVAIWVHLSIPDAVEASPFDWRELFNDLAILLSVTLRHRDCSVEIACPEVDLVVDGDRFAYLHVCLALTRAVLESMPRGGHLLFRAEPKSGNGLRCWIAQDTAAAVTPECEPVGTLAGMQGVQAASSGRGVSFARRTIERDGGVLWCEGSAARPVAFCFELPLVGEDLKSQCQAPGYESRYKARLPDGMS